MAPVRKGYQSTDGGQELPDHPVGSIKIIRRDESPNLVEIVDGLGVEIVAGHESGWERRAALLSRKWARTSSPGMGLTLPAFRSSYRLLSVSRTWESSFKYAATTSSTNSSGARPVSMASLSSLACRSWLKWTSMVCKD